MSVLNELNKRALNKCELCAKNEDEGVTLRSYVLAPKEEDINTSVLICENCDDAIKNPKSVDTNYWRFLSESMWSEHLPVQIMTWRVLDSLNEEAWAQDLKGQMYLEEESLVWASALTQGSQEREFITKDSNGTILNEGDSVTLIKDLVVKGANFTAKRGTLVKNINLTSNPMHIEGRINGTQIVLVAEYLKKV